MTTSEIIRLSIFVSIWLLFFQVTAAILFIAVKRTIRHAAALKEKRAGKTRCQAVFHCHCEKENGHEGDKHANESNMVIWE
jgi:hypothetical protein